MFCLWICLSSLFYSAFCLRNKSSLTINEPKTDPRVTESALSAISNVICCPIMLRDEAFGVLLVANKIKMVPPFLPLPFHSRDEDVMQYFCAVMALGLRLYQELIESPSTEIRITNLHRMLSHTSLQNLDEAAAAVELENFDYFLPPSRLSLPPGSRPLSKVRQLYSSTIDENSDDSLGKGSATTAFVPPPLRKATLRDPNDNASSSVSLMHSIKSIESFYRNDIDEKDNDATEGRFAMRSFNIGSSMQSRTVSQLRLMTLSNQNASMENIVGKFGDIYVNLLSSTSLSHLMDVAQTIVKEFLGPTFSYVCHLSAENGGSLVVSSHNGESILNLSELPKEVITALDWGIVTEVLTCGQRPMSQGRVPMSENLRIPGVIGTTALIVPLRIPQDYDVTDADDYMHLSDMTRLLIITKFGDRFSAFEKDTVELFAKILSESAYHVTLRDSAGDVHVHKKIQMLDSFSHLDRPFSLLLGFDGYYMVGSRDLTDVFGFEACRGHYTSWIGASNEQFLRDISNALENERGVAREDYLLTTPAATIGGGLALDYSILPLVDFYYGCHCQKCVCRGLQCSERPVVDTSTNNACLRKMRGGSFVVITCRASSQSMTDFRSFCRTPSSNPAGWFDEVESEPRLSLDMRNDVIGLVRRSRSRANDIMGLSANFSATLPPLGSTRCPMSIRSRSYSDIEGETGGHFSPDKGLTASLPQEYKVFTEYTMTTSANEICTWGLDVLKIKTKGMLRRLIYQVFTLAVDLSLLNVDSKMLHDYIKEISGMYNEVIFHNFYHAACITHATFMLIRATDATIQPNDRMKFALLLSALVHDVHHPGNTNLFEINSKSALAILYNDQSVLENHHCATAFRLMEKPGLGVLGSFSVIDQRDVRKLMVGAIMATDMSKHSDLMEETAVRANHPSSWTTQDITEKIFYSKIILHAADLSNPTRDFPVAFEWAKLIAAEFNEQTKLETALGLPVLNFMVSPDDITIVKNELSFSTFVVAPMWRGLAKLFPQLSGIVDCLSYNSERYSDLLEELEAKVAPETGFATK